MKLIHDMAFLRLERFTQLAHMYINTMRTEVTYRGVTFDPDQPK